MSVYLPNRRIFCLTAGAALLASRKISPAQSQIRPNIAAIDHDRILAAAALALNAPVTPLTSLPAPRSPGTPHDFYSEPDESFPAHRDAVYQLGITVAALTAATVITSEPRYAARASEHLRAWFLTPATRMAPSLHYAQFVPPSAGEKTARIETRPDGIVETTPLSEVARSLRFLAALESHHPQVLTPAELAAIREWFAKYATWLNESRTAGIARDSKDHVASSWLFQSSAYADASVAGLTSDDATLNTLRHRFRSVTLRAQMNAAGNFPREVSTANPYRDSLFNLDLLCLACDLLTTRFDNPWEYELQDGPGMRSSIAFHFPFLLNRAAWPYPADAAHFKELPGRRISLLLAGHAYRRPEYVDLWRSLSPLPDTTSPDLLRSLPISQPLLWFTKPRPV